MVRIISPAVPRRSNLDKRKAVTTLIEDSEWSRWSDSEVARRCGVSQPFVGQVRGSLITVISDPPVERTYTDRWGNETTMQTGDIGRRTSPVDLDTGELLDDDDG